MNSTSKPNRPAGPRRKPSASLPSAATSQARQQANVSFPGNDCSMESDRISLTVKKP
jgi:hypothetical protein